MDYAIGSHSRERIRQPTCVHPIGYSFSSSLTKQDFGSVVYYNNQHRRQEPAGQANLTSKSGGTIANVYRFNYIASNPIYTWR